MAINDGVIWKWPECRKFRNLLCCVGSVLTHLSSLRDMELLELEDPEARRWLHRREPRLHLLLGDSIARDSRMKSRYTGDRILNLAVAGATWKKVREQLQMSLIQWQSEAEEQGRTKGTAIVWLTGNDCYSRFSELPSFSDDKLEEVSLHAIHVTGRLLRISERVIVLGPLPRMSGELTGAQWVTCAAYHLERRLLHRLPAPVIFVPLGRQLTKKSAKKHCVTQDCLGWYKRDRTHLSEAGYLKLADDLPVWLTMPK